MSGNTPDEQEPWANLIKRPFTDEEGVILEAESYLSPDLSSPVAVARLFLLALQDIQANRSSLEQLVAPYTLPHWGDFSQAKAAIDAIPDIGVSNRPIRFQGFPHVAQVKVFNNVGEGFVVETPQEVLIPATVTLSYSTSRTMWLVYQLGEPLQPEQVAPVE